MSDPFYRSQAWHRLRSIVLRRDPVCVTPGCTRASKHVDHITPRSKGGADTPENTRGLCHSCHSRITRAGNVGPLRVNGCDANGMPLDPGHWWSEKIAHG